MDVDKERLALALDWFDQMLEYCVTHPHAILVLISSVLVLLVLMTACRRFHFAQ